MTVTSGDTRVSYSGDGSTQVFSYPYYFLEDGDLKVVLTDADGNETVQTLTTNYTVSGAGDASGGDVTMLTAPASGETLTILNDLAHTQGLDLVENDSLPAEAAERAIDRNTMGLKRLRDLIDRSIRQTDGDTGGLDMTLPAVAARQNKVLYFDANGEPAASAFDGISGEAALVDTLSALRAVDSGSAAYALVAGGSTVSDGDGRYYYLDAGDTSSAESVPEIIVAADGARWKLAWEVSAATLAASITALKALDKTGFNDGDTVLLTGYAAPGDGGGGEFYYDASDSTSSDDGGTIIVATDGGRWKRIFSGPIQGQWFGITADGSTDDTSAYENAVTAAVAADTFLELPVGTIQLASERTVTSNYRVRGQGMNKTTLRLSTDNVGESTFFTGDGVSNVVFEDLALDEQSGTHATTRTVMGLNDTTGGADIRFTRVAIPGSTSAGIVVDRSTNVVVEECDIQDCAAGDVIRCANGSAGNIKILNNSLTNLANLSSSRRVIQIGSADGFLCKGNYIDGATGTYVYDFGGTQNGLVTGDVVRNSRNVIDLENGAKNIAIVGNSFNGLGANNSAASGIVIFENPAGLTADDITITGNIINGFFHGLRLEGVRDTTVSGNTIQECYGHGISIVDGASGFGASNMAITGNTILNCSKAAASTYDGIFVKCDRGVVAGNFIRGTNHRYDINSDAANTIMHIGMNYAQTVNRSESYSYVQLSNRRVYEGSASPDGFVTANPGDLYLRSSGGAGTTLYVKESGTSNTGWVGK